MLSRIRPVKTCSPVSIQTSFAPLKVSLPEGIGYNVTAKTSFGKVTSDLPLSISGTVSGDALSGKIAGGGCELLLNNSNGDIEILKTQRP